MQRISLIEKRIQSAFTPAHLEVIDDSHEHVGHIGSQDGAGHYTIIIRSDSFDELTRIQAHRKIYDVLSDLIPVEIHALKIKII